MISANKKIAIYQEKLSKMLEKEPFNTLLFNRAKDELDKIDGTPKLYLVC